MMELIGGTLVLLAMALCGATICAGGLCTDKVAVSRRQARPRDGHGAG